MKLRSKAHVLSGIFIYTFSIAIISGNAFAANLHQDIPNQFEWGYIQVDLTRGSRALPSLVYYPALTQGADAVLDSSSGPYPVVVFSHGKYQLNSYYLPYFEKLARVGFIVIAPQLPDGDPNQNPEDLQHCLHWLLQQDAEAGSIFEGMIDESRVGAAGHSTGGGSTLNFTALEPLVGAAVALAPTNSSHRPTSDALANITVPVQMQVATRDGRLPMAVYGLPLYEAGNPIKEMVTIHGGNHYGFENYDGFDYRDSTATITREEQLSIAGYYMLHFFNIFLNYDNTSHTRIFGAIADGDTSVDIIHEIKDLAPFPFALLTPEYDARVGQTGFDLTWQDNADYDPSDPVTYEVVFDSSTAFPAPMVESAGSEARHQWSTMLHENGRYYWFVRATDAAGNVTASSDTLEVHVIGDITPPVVAITAPQDGETVLSSVVSVTGTVDDPSVTLVDVNGQTASVAGGAFQIDLTLSDGPYQIIAAAADSAWNFGRDTVSVIVDGSPPVIGNVEIVSIGTDAATIRWTTNELAIGRVNWGTQTPFANSTPWSSVYATSHEVQLTGLGGFTNYGFNIEAADEHGWQATSSDTSFRTASSDAVPPAVVITAPAEGHVSATSPVMVSGTVDDPSVGQVDVNGQAAAVTAGAFSLDLALSPGMNQIIASAVDSIGNVGRDTVTVILDNAGPEITNLAATSVTPYSASLTWQTGEPATGRAEFGTTTAYGNSVVETTPAGQTHQVPLEGLQPATLYHVRVTALDTLGNISQSQDFAFSTHDLSVARVNCGGPGYTDLSGKTWDGDRVYSAGGWGYVGGGRYRTSSAIANTQDDALFQTERFGMSEYRFDLANGEYEVDLLFAEIYFTEAGRRVFDVSLEGATALNGFDIYAEAGPKTALTKTLPVTVTDGQLNIGFVDVANASKISAIAIRQGSGGAPLPPQLGVQPTALDFGLSITSLDLNVTNAGSGVLNWAVTEIGDAPWLAVQAPASGVNNGSVTVAVDRTGQSPGTYTLQLQVSADNGQSDTVAVSMEVHDPGSASYVQRVNAGGIAYTDGGGNEWSGDQPYSSGSWGYIRGGAYSRADAISGTDEEPLFQSERYGMREYRFDVENGTYQVRLLFAEIFWNAPDRRVMDVMIEDNLVLDNYDIYASVGHNAADSHTFLVEVADGQLNIAFEKVKDSPKVSAIEVIGNSGPPAPKLPKLAVTPLSLDFGSQATALNVQISNAGDSTLSWTVIEVVDHPWLSLAPAAGSNAGTVVVSVDRTMLAPGTYSGALRVDADNGESQEIPVTMTVPAGPELSVSTTALDFGDVTNQLQFDISNTGGGLLSWTLETSTGTTSGGNAPQATGAKLKFRGDGERALAALIWLSVNPMSGTNSAVVTAMVDRGSLAPGSYSGNITVTADNGQTHSISVSMTVLDTPEIVYSQRVNAGGSSYTDGNGNEWASDQAYSTGKWGYINGSKYSTRHSIVGTGDDQLYQSERNNLNEYRFDVPDGDYTVRMLFVEIYFNNPGRRKFDVSIEGVQVLNSYDIYAEVGHDQAAEKTFETTVADGQLNIEFSDIKNVAKIAAVEVIGVQQPQGPQPPQLAVNADTLDFGTTQTSLALQIMNAGDSTLNWSALESPDMDWLALVAPVAGAAPAQLTVQVDRTNQAPSTYQGVIRISADNGQSQDVTVLMTVPGPPQLSLSPDTLKFGASATDLFFDVANLGDGLLDWQVDVAALPAWLTVSPPSGQNDAAVAVTADRTGLDPGVHGALIIVTADSQADTMIVTMDVSAAPTVIYEQRVNAGGLAYTDVIGKPWDGDQAYSTGGWGYIGGKTYATRDAIIGTDDDLLFKSERFKMQEYRFDVPNGEYEVRLLFAEIYWRRSGGRVFEVAIEGDVVADALDIYAQAGHDAALTLSFTKTVLDAQLNISFRNIADAAKISAIEVIGYSGSIAPPARERIMLMGNSITYGVGSSDGLGFRQKLHDELSNAGLDFEFVGSSGAAPYRGHFQGGRKVEDFYPSSFGNGWGTGRVDATADLNTFRPTMVVVHLGTNDINSQSTPQGPYSSDGGQTLFHSNAGEMAELLLYLLQWKDGTIDTCLKKILVSKIIPMEFSNDKVLEYNAALEDMVVAFNNGGITGVSEGIRMVDHYTPFITHPNLFDDSANDIMDDDLHPNDQGYDLMAATNRTAIVGAAFNAALASSGMYKVEYLELVTTWDDTPKRFELFQNYPNPFNPSTTISYTIPGLDLQNATLRVYNIQGQLVRELVSEPQAPGRYLVEWDGANDFGNHVASGVYIYTMRAGPYFDKKLMTLVK